MACLRCLSLNAQGSWGCTFSRVRGSGRSNESHNMISMQAEDPQVSVSLVTLRNARMSNAVHLSTGKLHSSKRTAAQVTACWDAACFSIHSGPFWQLQPWLSRGHLSLFPNILTHNGHRCSMITAYLGSTADHLTYLHSLDASVSFAVSEAVIHSCKQSSQRTPF